ncbi:transcriptional repressor [Leucobacter luti]|nr:Fur family transcriptional regulator [Leucobacter luti]MBL3698901.1 transcriptional repressor [Leucobacter luti]
MSAAGLRSTAPRRAVLEILAEGGHWEASDMYERLREQLPGTSLQAVYGVLSALTEAGLARRISPVGGPAQYEAHVGDNHHHLVCRDCGRMEDVPCVVGSAPCLTPSDTHGFVVETANITFLGRCAACAAALRT